jgi:HlyD family secretion protein
LDQPRVTGVKVGQEAIVEVDALPGRTFEGKVVRIGETARRPPLEGTWRTGSETTFPVTIDLPKMKKALMRPGMRANTVIVTRRIEDVVTVPAECVFEREGGSIVYVERNGQYQERTVEVGTSSGDYTEIVRGLKQGERVALNDLGGEESSEGHAS